MSREFGELVSLAFDGSCPYPLAVVNDFKISWQGNVRKVTPVSIRDGVSEDVHKLASMITAYVNSLPPLDNELDRLISESSFLNDPERLRCACRARQFTADELGKLTSVAVSARLVRLGVSEVDAWEVARLVYKRRREQCPDEVVQRTPRERGFVADERKDKSVCFANCNFLPKDIAPYLENIRSNTALRSLDLSGNNLRLDGALLLADALRELPLLDSLNICGNNVLYEGIAAVCDALVNKSDMRLLDVSNNGGGQETGSALACALWLSVIGNDITPAGLEALAQPCTKTSKLLLGTNGLNGPEAMNGLAVLLRKTQGLAELDLSDNGITNEDLPTLSKLLISQKGLVAVDLSLNRFTNNEAILKWLSLNTFVTDVKVASPAFFAAGNTTDINEEPVELINRLSTNKKKLNELRSQLEKKGVNNWTRQNVRDAFTYLMRRRDIAVELPIDGASIAAMTTWGRKRDWEDICRFLERF